MTVKLRTGKTGEAITSGADGRLYASLVGSGSYVTGIGNKCTATLDGPNKLMVHSGCIFHNGRFIDLEGDTEWTIPSGVQAQKRSNLCVVRYTKFADGSEDCQPITLTGEATSDGTPVDPEYNDASVLENATVSDFPLYRVVTDGINALDPVPLFPVVMSAKELQDSISKIRYVDVDIPAQSWDAGTPGVRCAQWTAKLEDLIGSKTLLSIESIYVRKTYDYFLITAYAAGYVYANFYRGTSTAYSNAGPGIEARIRLAYFD